MRGAWIENKGRTQMRQIALFAVLAALILVGIEKWNVTAIREEPVLSGGVDTFAIMASAKDLPTSRYDDYSLVFD
jgi:hypothetical protein